MGEPAIKLSAADWRKQQAKNLTESAHAMLQQAWDCCGALVGKCCDVCRSRRSSARELQQAAAIHISVLQEMGEACCVCGDWDLQLDEAGWCGQCVSTCQGCGCALVEEAGGEAGYCADCAPRERRVG